MANDVFANNREISCKAGEGKTICAFPDTCFTPPENPATPPGVPVPYPNTGMSKDTIDGTKTVKISGKEVMLKDLSYFKTSYGDEAGCAAKKGVVTSVHRGKVYFTSWSMDVKFEGENVVRHLDLTTNNHASKPGQTPPFPETDSMAMGGAKKKDPCKHPNDKKKKKYIIYIAMDLKNPGKTYVGRTSGKPGDTTEAILGKRKAGHHRNLGPLRAVCETDSYAAVRGAEQLHRESVAKSGKGTKQINPISPKNPRKQDYIDCAKQKNKSTCGVCGA